MRWRTALAFTLVVAMVAAIVTATPAAPADADVSHGDMVDYDLAFPVEGKHELKDTFGACRAGCSRRHEGQDIFAKKMVPVVASNTGRVRYVNWSTSPGLNPARCCSIVIDHNDGWQSRYIHLNNDDEGDDGEGWGIADGIAPGVKVKAGQLIGWVGDSGNAENSGSHLHYELLAPGGIVVNSYDSLIKARSDGNSGGGDPLFDSSGTIRKGDSGAAVERLQEVLNDLGYGAGPEDGKFGNKTLAAVLLFQADAGLKTDGLVGNNTKTELEDRISPKPTLRRGDRGEDVVSLQQLLNENGYDVGNADGIFGPNTESGVTAFQKAEGLKVDGVVGKNTWSALRSH